MKLGEAGGRIRHPAALSQALEYPGPRATLRVAVGLGSDRGEDANPKPIEVLVLLLAPHLPEGAWRLEARSQGSPFRPALSLEDAKLLRGPE